MSGEVRLVAVPDFRKIKSLFDFRVERDRSGTGLFVATKAFNNYDVATYTSVSITQGVTFRTEGGAEIWLGIDSTALKRELDVSGTTLLVQVQHLSAEYNSVARLIMCGKTTHTFRCNTFHKGKTP